MQPTQQKDENYMVNSPLTDVVSMPVPQLPERQLIWNSMNRMLSDPNYSPERVRDAYAIAKMMLADLAVVTFNAAFSDAQKEFKPAVKNRKITIRSKDAKPTDKPIQETQYSDWFAHWEGVQVALNKNGLSLSFDISAAVGQPVTVTAILEHRDGHSRRVSITLPHDSTGSKNAVQAIGSSIAYGKRYTGMAILNLTAEDDETDDDGKSAGAPATISEEQLSTINQLMTEAKVSVKSFCNNFKIETVDALPAASYDEAVLKLKQKIAAKPKEEPKPEAPVI